MYARGKGSHKVTWRLLSYALSDCLSLTSRLHMPRLHSLHQHRIRLRLSGCNAPDLPKAAS